MSFQAYINNIKTKTGKTPADFKKLAETKGLLAYQFEGDRYDTGDRLGYLNATLTFGLRRPELREGLLKLMEEKLGKK